MNVKSRREIDGNCKTSFMNTFIYLYVFVYNWHIELFNIYNWFLLQPKATIPEVPSSSRARSCRSCEGSKYPQTWISTGLVGGFRMVMMMLNTSKTIDWWWLIHMFDNSKWTVNHGLAIVKTGFTWFDCNQIQQAVWAPCWSQWFIDTWTSHWSTINTVGIPLL